MPRAPLTTSTNAIAPIDNLRSDFSRSRLRSIHPIEAGEAPHHEITLMCDDIEATVRDLRERGIEVRCEPENQGFGIVVTIVLPGDVEVLVYEPRHPTAI